MMSRIIGGLLVLLFWLAIYSALRGQAPIIFERDQEETWDAQSVKGLAEYKRSHYTQALSETSYTGPGGPFYPTILPIDRAEHEERYQVPGGLVGIKGWYSKTYRSKVVAAQKQMVPVKNSSGFYQNSQGWVKTYPTGMVFDDVLINARTGIVFEHRRRTKEEDGWRSEILYRNRSARPNGYEGLSVSRCQECHKDAGSGEYGKGLAPGSDGVFSDPFPALEQ